MEEAGRVKALCATRPAEWWETGDGGNRLALLLCSVCPERPRCDDGDREPHGVIRAGIAYGDDGQRLALCPCGRPVVSRRGRVMCLTCLPSQHTVVPGYLRVRQRRGKVDSYFDLIGVWRSQGVTFAEIGVRLRMRKDTVRKAWNSRRPQASSTGVGG